MQRLVFTEEDTHMCARGSGFSNCKIDFVPLIRLPKVGLKSLAWWTMSAGRRMCAGSLIAMAIKGATHYRDEPEPVLSFTGSTGDHHQYLHQHSCPVTHHNFPTSRIYWFLRWIIFFFFLMVWTDYLQKQVPAHGNSNCMSLLATHSPSLPAHRPPALVQVVRIAKCILRVWTSPGWLFLVFLTLKLSGWWKRHLLSVTAGSEQGHGGGGVGVSILQSWCN